MMGARVSVGGGVRVVSFALVVLAVVRGCVFAVFVAVVMMLLRCSPNSQQMLMWRVMMTTELC